MQPMTDKSKFSVATPFHTDKAPFYNTELNRHHYLIESFAPGEYSDKLLAWALDRYSNMPLNPADSAGVDRNSEQRLAKGVMGILAEAWVRTKIANFAALIEGSEFGIKSLPPQFNADGEFEQVDILVSKRRKKEGAKAVEVKVEVRSSFNYYSLNNAIFGGFSVLGPYGNEIKPGETLKDVYLFVAVDLGQKNAGEKYVVRTGVDNKQIDFSKTTTNVLLGHTLEVADDGITVKNPFDLVLVGGATGDMFSDEALAEPMKGNAGYKNENFRSIGIAKAMDATSVLKRILAT